MRRNPFFSALVFGCSLLTVGSLMSHLAAPLAQAQERSTPPLTNEDVLKMVRAHLGNGVIIAKIRSSPCKFDDGTDALIQLKQAGVSDSVLQAMTQHCSAPISGGQVLAAAPSSDPNDPSAPHDPGIYVLRESAGGKEMFPLEPTTFGQAKASKGLLSAVTGGVVQAQMKVVVMGGRANIRLTESQPQFYFYFAERSAGPTLAAPWLAYFAGASSANQFVLVRIEAKKDKRELVVAEEGAFFRSSAGTREKDVVQCGFERVAPGVYKVVPKESLELGEYAFMYAGSNTTYGAGGQLFDFGVDRPK